MDRDAESPTTRLINAATGRGRYKSCNWIEDAVFISGEKVKACCMQGIGNRDAEGTLSISEGSISIDKILQAKRSLRIENQTEYAPCNGCYKLQEGDWEAKEFLDVVALAGFLHCNLSCGYCTSYDFNPKEPSGNIIKIIKELIESGGLRAHQSAISWGGGEPTLHKDFGPAAQLAFSHGVFMTVFTNATALSMPLLEGLAKGLANVVCSVDAGTAETYKRIKGRDFFARVMGNLAAYAKADADRVEAKYIMMEANCRRDEIDQFLAAVSKAGVKRVNCSINTHSNAASQGDPSEAIVDGIVYMMVRCADIGLKATLAEVIWPETQERIAHRVAERAIAEVAPLHRPAMLDLAFANSAVFLRKFKQLVEDAENFCLVFADPAPLADPPSALALVAALGGIAETNGLYGGFLKLSKAYHDIWLRQNAAMATLLPRVAGYEVIPRIDEANGLLLSLEFHHGGREGLWMS